MDRTLYGLSKTLIRIAAITTLAAAIAHAPAAHASGSGYTSSTSAGNGTTAQLNAPAGVAVDGFGNIYIADSANHRVRKVTPLGTITTVAGNGRDGDIGDRGPATGAELVNPVGVAVDQAGNIFIADSGAGNVREVDALGIIHTVAACPASNCTNFTPVAVAVDNQGNLFVSDYADGAVFRVDYGTTSSISIVDDSLTSPLGLAVISSPTAGQDTLFVADSGAVYKITQADSATPSLPTNSIALVDGAYGLGLDANGSLLVTSITTQQIFSITDPAGTAGTAGSPTSIVDDSKSTCAPATAACGDGGDAASAQMNSPQGVVVNTTTGHIYIADTLDNRVRELTPSPNSGSGGGSGGTDTPELGSGELLATGLATGLAVLLYRRRQARRTDRRARGSEA